MSAQYIVEQREDNWQRASRLVNFLLREKAEIRWAIEKFSAEALNGKPLELQRGAFLITNADTISPRRLKAALDHYGVPAAAVADLRGFEGLLLHRLRIAIYGGGGAPFNHARIFAELGFQVEFISAQEIRSGKLDDYDLFVVPGGGGLAMAGQLNPLGDEGCRLIKAWVQRGGMYIGSCAGSFNAAIVAESFLAGLPATAPPAVGQCADLEPRRYGMDRLGITGCWRHRKPQPEAGTSNYVWLARTLQDYALQWTLV